jgi:hypothetical protein
VATLIARNLNEGIVAPIARYGGIFLWGEYGVWCQVIGFLLVRLTVPLIHFIKTFYKVSILNTFYKDNGAVSRITVQRKSPFPSTLKVIT